MVARYGRYYGDSLKVYGGVVQGDSMSLTIFNMVMDALIQHWVAVVAGEEAGPEGFGIAVQTLSILVYAYYVLLISSQLD